MPGPTASHHTMDDRSASTSAREPTRVGILLSGRGSNFLALHAAMKRGEIPAQIVLVVSNRADAPGLAKAAELGIPTSHVPLRTPTRAADEATLQAALTAAAVEWICLAGYMKILSPKLIRAYRQRILNIHPSLLPAFPGLNAQLQALEYGVKVTGCTVHLVDEGLDSGPIVHQEAVPVLDGDSVEALAARILAVEHKIYSFTLRRLLTEPWSVSGRRVVFAPGAIAGD